MQRRLKEGYLKMIPIAEQNIVRLNAPARPPGEDDRPTGRERARPADEVEQPNSLRAGLPRSSRPVQRLFLPAGLSPDDQARRVRRTRRGKTRRTQDDLRRARRDLDANNEVLAHNCPSRRSWPMRRISTIRDALIPLLATALQIPASEISEKFEAAGVTSS